MWWQAQLIFLIRVLLIQQTPAVRKSFVSSKYACWQNLLSLRRLNEPRSRVWWCMTKCRMRLEIIYPTVWQWNFVGLEYAIRGRFSGGWKWKWKPFGDKRQTLSKRWVNLNSNVSVITGSTQCSERHSPDYRAWRPTYYGIIYTCKSYDWWKTDTIKSSSLAGKLLRFLAREFEFNKNLFAKQKETAEWEPICMDQLFFLPSELSTQIYANLEDQDIISSGLYPLTSKAWLDLVFAIIHYVYLFG